MPENRLAKVVTGGAAAALAALGVGLAVALTGSTASAHLDAFATTAPPPPPTTTTAVLAVSPSGNDASCSRGGSACGTFNRAFQLAQSGDTISVHGGSYPSDSPSIGGYQLDPNASLTSPVTFVCAGDGDVTFQGPVFYFWAGAGWATFQGGCFRFHVVFIGVGGYSERTHDIALDGVHMESFNISGAKNVTIRNSEVGPFVACGSPGSPAYAACPAGSYWAQFANGTDAGGQQEPFIHDGAAGTATNVLLDNDRIHGISSLWAGTHTGGLLVWGTDGLTVSNTTFDNDAIYDIEYNACSCVENGNTFSNVTFGVPVYSADPTEPQGPLPTNWTEFGLAFGGTLSNFTMSDSTFVNGLSTTWGGAATTFTNVRFTSNNFGAGTTCIPGASYSGNSQCNNAPPPVTTTAPTTTAPTTTTVPTTTAVTTTAPTTTTVPPTTTTASSGPLGLKVVSRTTSKITVGWTPYPGVGYEFLKDGARVSNTWDPARSQVTFAYTAGSTYTVRALGNAAEDSVKG